MTSWLPSVFWRTGKKEEEAVKEEEEEGFDGEWMEKEKSKWTTDGLDPYICLHVNAHGSMNDHRHSDIIPNDKKQTDMDIHAFSIAGNKNQFGLMGIVRGIPPHVHEDFECNNKAIDYCIPSVLRKVFYSAKKQKDGDGDSHATYNVAIKKVKGLYFHAGLFHQLQTEGGFEVMEEPTRFHFYQLHGSRGENIRPSSRLKLPKREAAGDIKLSDQMIYGVWVVDTNITVLQDLALTAITDTALRILPENRKSDSTHLYLPPKRLNRMNMASRSNGGESLGGARWDGVLTGLKKYDGLAGNFKKMRARARLLLSNLWRTRTTNSHNIIDIFAPFSEIGKKLGTEPLKLYTIDVSCRSKFGVIVPPNPREHPGLQPIEDSQAHYDGRPDDDMGSPSLSKSVQHGEDDGDDGDEDDDGGGDGGGAFAGDDDGGGSAIAGDDGGGDPVAPDVPFTSQPSMRSQQPKPTPTPKNTSRSGVSKASVTRKTDPVRPPWRGGSTKRKNSRKRNTRTRNRHTRRRTRH